MLNEKAATFIKLCCAWKHTFTFAKTKTGRRDRLCYGKIGILCFHVIIHFNFAFLILKY